jgi:hypothetical protein
MISKKAKKRINGWRIMVPQWNGPESTQVWHDGEERGRNLILGGHVAISTVWVDNAFEADGEFELYYLLEADEVWLAPQRYERRHTQQLKELLGRRYSVEAAMREIFGEPLARCTCPDTPEELLTWARMAAAVVGGQ